MPRSGSVKCLNCQQFFIPHPRSKGRQRFCSHQDCQCASKRHSQQQWLSKPENRDYFKGPEHVRRVQQWRRQHPCYSRKQKRRQDTPSPLQEDLIVQPVDMPLVLCDWVVMSCWSTPMLRAVPGTGGLPMMKIASRLLVLTDQRWPET